jgi:hypothetical protein
MAELVSVVRPGETIDNVHYPKGEVLLSMTYEEAVWLRYAVGHTGPQNERARDSESSPDVTIWRPLHKAGIRDDKKTFRYTSVEYVTGVSRYTWGELE